MDAGGSLETFVHFGTSQVELLVEALTTVVIAAAVIIAFVRLAMSRFNFTSMGDGERAVRVQLGRGLLLGLEFSIAADVLRSIVAPTWTDLGELAVIVIIRTALSYFLDREIREGTP